METNCLTEILFEDATRQAQLLDEYYRTHGKIVGPLHGLPITLKDQFNVKGVDTTLGYVARSFHPAQDDAALVQILHELGAVVFAKTNIPQSIMVFILTSAPNVKADGPSGVRPKIRSGG